MVSKILVTVSTTVNSFDEYFIESLPYTQHCAGEIAMNNLIYVLIAKRRKKKKTE